MTDIVNDLARAGFALFPLRGKKPNLPQGTDWTKTEHDPFLCRDDFPDNYAVIANKWLILDIDCKKQMPGKESFAQLTKDAGLKEGWESETFVVRTGTGGFHIYLSVPEGFKTRKNFKAYKGVEVLHGNFYVVGPGSIHPDTQTAYTVIFGTPQTILAAPDGLLNILTTVETEDLGEQPVEGFVDDDPMNVERFKEALKLMPEISTGNRNNSAYIAACRGRDFGISAPLCITILSECYNHVKLNPPIEDAEIADAVINAYKHARNQAGNLNVGSIFKPVDVTNPEPDNEPVAFDMTESSKGVMRVQKTLHNIVLYLRKLPQLANVFRYNVFSGNIELSSLAPWYHERGERGPNICDEDAVLLKYFLARTVKMEFQTEQVWDSIVIQSHQRHYHPVRNYLQSLKWDGVPRIDTWLTDYGHALDTEYTRQISRKILCAGVRRAMQPGCKQDYVLVIEGKQGIGKSTICRILGRNWGGDMNLDPHSKDSIHMMLGKWIIELSEMTALRWADSNALKSFLTREKDTVRLSYERHAKDFPRQSIFIGTVNPEHVGYLNDVTGNRRYWVVNLVGQVDLVGLENVCDQLWAEAMAKYEKEIPYLTGDAVQLQVLETQQRMPEDPIRGNVTRWMRENPEIMDVSCDEILEYMGVPMKSISRQDQNRVAFALLECGWVKKIIRPDGYYMTRYERPLKDQIRQVLG